MTLHRVFITARIGLAAVLSWPRRDLLAVARPGVQLCVLGFQWEQPDSERGAQRLFPARGARPGAGRRVPARSGSRSRSVTWDTVTSGRGRWRCPAWWAALGSAPLGRAPGSSPVLWRGFRVPFREGERLRGDELRQVRGTWPGVYGPPVGEGGWETNALWPQTSCCYIFCFILKQRYQPVGIWAWSIAGSNLISMKSIH